MRIPTLRPELTGEHGLRNFVYLVWRHLGLPDPTPVQYDICDYLQHGPERLVVQAYRGAGKSWITAAYAVWLLLLDPQLKILVVSASKDRSDAFSTFVRRLIDEIPECRHLAPKKGQRDSRVAFDVGPSDAAQSPSIRSVGISGQMTGSRADIIIADDVEVANNSDTEVKRIKLAESIKEFDAILKPPVKNQRGEVIKRGGRVRFLGTPQSEQSVYSLLPERGYEIRIWPARLPTERQQIAYGDRLSPLIQHALEDPSMRPGDPVDPLRFDDDDLTKREASYGRSGFALQFQLDTSLSDAERYPLRLRDLIVMDLDLRQGPEKLVWAGGPQTLDTSLPNVGFNGDGFHRPMAIQGDFIPWSGVVMAIDPSGRGADECAVSVVKALNGFLYLTACIGFYGEGFSDETLKNIAEVAELHQVNHIVVEQNFGNGMFTVLLGRALNDYGYPCFIEEVRHSTQKEARIIDTLEPVMNQHKLVVGRDVVENDRLQVNPHIATEKQTAYTLFHQMTRLTRERGALAHDDRLDSLAIAVDYWVRQIGVSADEAMEDRQQELLELELQRFAQNSVGDIVAGVELPVRSWLTHRRKMLG